MNFVIESKHLLVMISLKMYNLTAGRRVRIYNNMIFKIMVMDPVLLITTICPE